MGLENLKSIFAEGMTEFNNTDVTKMISEHKVGFPGPVNAFKDTHATGFTLNFESGNKTQYKIPATLPVLDSMLLTNLSGLNSTLTIGGGTFTQGDAFGDGHLFQHSFTELSQTQLTDMSSEYSDVDGIFSQPDIFGDNILFQQNMYPDGTSQLLELNGTSVFQQGMGGIFNKSTTYESSKFTPMSSLNVPSIEQILTSGNVNSSGYISQKQSYDKLDVINGTGENINVSGIPIRTVDGMGNLISDITKNRKFPSDTSWSNLYDQNHKSKGVGHNYGPDVRSVFGIRDDAPNIRGLSRNAFLGMGQGEPYIISNLPDGDIGGLDGGRVQNFASRSIPIVRAGVDALRLGKYLVSPSGLLTIAKQNALGLFSRVDYTKTLFGIETKITSPQRFGTFYNPLATAGSALARLLGTTPNVLIRRDELLPGAYPPFDKYENQLGLTKLSDTFGGSNELLGAVTGVPIAAGVKARNYYPQFGLNSGDKMTISRMLSGEKIDNDGGFSSITPPEEIIPQMLPTNIEVEKDGMPFYFKDLRDDTYIFFRAYIDGLTENISPSWAPTNYLGRSEPVYVYERSERDISFNLKLFAQTPSELDSIYQKMNRLTSLCYPQYAKDTVGDASAKQRMKPPLTKFRLGELFGHENNELTGFIKSISYTFPQESPWETKQGKRVPKYVQVAISYQVIHMKVPSLDFARPKNENDASNTEVFYGTTKAVAGVGLGVE